MSSTVVLVDQPVNIDLTINVSSRCGLDGAMYSGQMDSTWISAAEAARLLEVTRETIYAYVSRGYVRSQTKPGGSRERRYSRDDVERLRRRTDARRDPDKAAARTLRWGLPVLESSITLIDDDTLYYRGHDAVTLARTRSLEDVAALIWTGSVATVLGPPSGSRSPSGPPSRSGPARDVSFIARAQAALASASTRDPFAFDLRPESVAQCGWRILDLLTHVATSATSATRTERADAATARNATGSDSRGHPGGAAESVDRTLSRAWRAGTRGADVLRSALILCADHELNVSSFTARCVASAGADPYAVVIAGLAALGGTRHGGIGARVDAMLDSLRHTRDLRGALTERLRRGEPLYGFGHPLYRTGDPRAKALLDLLHDRYATSAELAFVTTVIEAAGAVLRESPNIDFALAATARVLRLPSGSALTLFALGRTIGWIGHAIEQYATGQLIRPRAKYVGVQPGVDAKLRL